MLKRIRSILCMIVCFAMLLGCAAYAESAAPTGTEENDPDLMTWLNDGWKLLKKGFRTASDFVQETLLPVWEKKVEEYYAEFSRDPEVQSAWETLKEGAEEAGRVTKEAATEAYNVITEWVQENGGTISQEFTDALHQIAVAAGVEEDAGTGPEEAGEA